MPPLEHDFAPQADLPPLAPHRGPSIVWPMVAGAAIFAVGCGGGTIVGWALSQAAALGAGFGPAYGGGGAYYEQADVYIDVERPAELTVGEPFDLVITVSDTRSRRRVIEDIDLDGAVCDIFRHDALEPEPQVANVSYGYREHVYSTPLEADGSKQFTFTLTPLQAGEFDSTITVYMDDYNSEEYHLRLEVGQ